MKLRRYVRTLGSDSAFHGKSQSVCFSGCVSALLVQELGHAEDAGRAFGVL